MKSSLGTKVDYLISNIMTSHLIAKRDKAEMIILSLKKNVASVIRETKCYFFIIEFTCQFSNVKKFLTVTHFPIVEKVMYATG